MNYKGYEIDIFLDECPESPREWDNIGTIYYKHPDYKIGDHSIDDPIDFLEEFLGKTPKNEYSKQRLQELIKEAQRRHVLLNVYLYDHSGLSLSTRPFSCPWDSCQVGFIVCTLQKAQSEYGLKRWSDKTKRSDGKVQTMRQAVTDFLQCEIQTFGQYISGDVFGYNITKDGEDIDSCCGFYGYDNTLNEATDIINNITK